MAVEKCETIPKRKGEMMSKKKEETVPTVHTPTVNATTQPPRPNFATQTTVLQIQITENANGACEVEWVAKIKDSDIVVPMRPAHVLGTLESAKLILASKLYKLDKTPVVQ